MEQIRHSTTAYHMNIHIPTYDEVLKKHERETLNAMELFVFSHEPIGMVEEWRRDLHSLIEYVLRKEDK